MTAPVKAQLRFDEFELNLAARKLLRRGSEISLTPKAFDTLCYLIEHRDRVVTKEELRAHLWPDVNVEENALSQNISRVRKALGGEGYVETVSRIGFRFTGRVVEAAPPAPVKPSSWRIAAVCAAMLLVLGGASLLIRARATARVPGQPAKVDPAAYESYIRGRTIWARRETASHPEAGMYFQEAVRRDPNFALGWVGLADYYVLQGPPQPEAWNAVTRALAIQPDLGEAWASAGFYKMVHEWDWKSAGQYLRRSVELAPDYEYGRKWLGEYLAITGKPQEAVAQLEAAVRAHPDSPAAHAGLCSMLYFAGRLSDAVQQCQVALDAFPNFRRAHRTLFEIAFDMGDADQTFTQWMEAGGNSPKDPADPAVTAYRRGGLKAVWRFIAQQQSTSGTYTRADALMRLGETEETLSALEQARDRHDFLIVWAAAEPVFSKLHGNPRFEKILRSMGL
jgi:DNA-binding winged helix-turn-helix (wHTH) protein/tetratricopeptide (TPR) repeat protein